MKDKYSIIRFASYNYNSAQNIFNHDFRIKSARNINFDRSDLNIYAYSVDREQKIYRFDTLQYSSFDEFFRDEKEKYKFEFSRDKLFSNTIVLHEFLITASFEFFEELAISKRLQNKEDYISLLNNEKFNEWLKASMLFMQSLKWYSKGTKLYTVHLDEKTPHIHVLLLPLWEDFQKNTLELNSTKILGNKFEAAKKFRFLQDNYNKAVAHLDLKRGIEKEITNREHIPVHKLREMNDILLKKISEYYDMIRNNEISKDELIKLLTNNDKSNRLYAHLSNQNDINLDVLRKKISDLEVENTKLRQMIYKYLNSPQLFLNDVDKLKKEFVFSEKEVKQEKLDNKTIQITRESILKTISSLKNKKEEKKSIFRVAKEAI